MSAKLVREFHEKFNVPNGKVPRLLDDKRSSLRYDLICEETNELGDAVIARDLPAIADALADLLYVVHGAALEYGIDLDAVVAEVHAANMRKEGGGKRADGKILKPPGWVGPDVEGVLRAQGWKP